MDSKYIIILIISFILVSSSIGIGIYFVNSKSVITPVTIPVTIPVTTPVTTPDTTPVVKPVPFVAETQQGTTMSDMGKGTINYLDRHTMDCSNKALNELHYQKNTAGDKFQMQYTCASGGKLGTLSDKVTDLNDTGNWNTGFLDRHNADCGVGNVMTKLHLNTNNDKMQWAYTCAPSIQNTCRQISTDMSDDGGGNSMYLDRHDIKCNSNEALQQLQLVRNPEGNKYQFKYTCCS